MKLNDSQLVRREYENEQGLTTRRAMWANTDGTDPWEVAFGAVKEVRPRRVLEVGAGPGEFAERLGRDLSAEVIAVDLSPRMVELTRARGVEARLGDVQELEFEDGSFDCAVAAWMLYHVPDLDRGLGQLSRVLRPGGGLVAATNSENNLTELWSLLGDLVPSSISNSPARTPASFLQGISSTCTDAKPSARSRSRHVKTRTVTSRQRSAEVGSPTACPRKGGPSA